MPNQYPPKLLRRLLKLFPIKVLRDEFETGGVAQDTVINDVLINNAPNAIVKFAADNFNFTKQHVYIFKLDRNFVSAGYNNGNTFPYHIAESTVTPTGIVLYCLPLIRYEVILINPYQNDGIDFYQPVRITLDNDNLIIQFTILEKNIDSYFGHGRVVHSNRIPEETAIKNEIVAFFAQNYGVEICDINRGVKHLWDNDLIDCKFVKFTKAESTSTETMHEDRTYKNTYPAEYTTMMQSPLNKLIIKYIMGDEEFCDLFTVDASSGEISFTKYPITANQIQNVITQILSNN